MSPIYSHGMKANLRAGRKCLESLIKSVTVCGNVLEAECGSRANSCQRRLPEDYIYHGNESLLKYWIFVP
jgi:hypothetical protein